MSKLPRNHGGGTIRPPSTGMTLSRMHADFSENSSGLPTFAQRSGTVGRRATLSSSTFMAPTEISSPPGNRASGIPGTLSRASHGSSGAASPTSVLPSAHGLMTPVHSAGIKEPAARGGTIARPFSQQNASVNAKDLFAGSSAASSKPATPLNRGHALHKTIEGSPMANSADRPQSPLGLRVGEPVFIPSMSLSGTLRFLGTIDGKQGMWAGVELDEQGKGKNDGSAGGKAYFSCAPKTGLFLTHSKVEPRSSSTTAASSEGAPTQEQEQEQEQERKKEQEPAAPPKHPGVMAGRASRLAAMSTNMKRAAIIRGPGAAKSQAKPMQQPATARRPTVTRPGASAVDTGRPRAPTAIRRNTSQRTGTPSPSRPTSSTPTSSLGDNSLNSSRPRIGSNRVTSPDSSTGFGRHRTGLRPPQQLTSEDGSEKNAPTENEFERMRLRVDMLEAENRVLRLKNEQGKAHLAAGQMLARDLALVSPDNASPPNAKGHAMGKNRTAHDNLTWQLREERDMREREREASQLHITELERQIKELSASPPPSGPVDAQSSAELESHMAQIADLEERLASATQQHAEELTRVQAGHSGIADKLAESTASLNMLHEQMSVKDRDALALTSKLERTSAELARTTQKYTELMQEQEQRNATDVIEESERVERLTKQVDSLRRELSAAEDQVHAASSELQDTQQAQSKADSELTKLQAAYSQLESKTAGFDVQAKQLAAFRDCLQHITETAQNHIADAELDESSDIGVRAQHLVDQLVDLVQTTSARADELAHTAETTAVSISELEQELEAAKQSLPDADPDADADAAVDADADSDDASMSPAKHIKALRARVSELETMNDELVTERVQFLDEQRLVNDYLEKLESESNRLVEDIEQLTAENQRLIEDLRAVSLQNSTVSLDMTQVDRKLSQQSGESNAEEDGEPQPVVDNSSEWSAQLESLRASHRVEVTTLKSQLIELEKRKNAESKKLHDEISSLENLIEDKIFSEEDFTNRINELTDEVDRLQREIQRLRQSGGGGSSSSSKTKSVSLAQDTDAPAASAELDDGLEDDNGDGDGDEYCDICDEHGHSIADCPLMATPSNLFKQETKTDSSRMYCDNCEAFSDHWTYDCPHGDETF